MCVAKGGEQFAKGQELHDSIEEYPILDEQAFSEMEHDEATRYWAEGYSPKDRVEYLRECGEIPRDHRILKPTTPFAEK